ncbi:6234_t:CDS:2, partial [Racocetra fulgida]
ADKRRAAAADAEAYRRDTALPSLAKIMTKNEITENELDAATQTQYENLKNGEITEPDAIIAAEKLITEKISQQGASKKLNHLLTQAKKALKSGQKAQIETALKELVALTIADNVYWQQAYEAQPETNSLLSQLRNYSGQNNTKSPTPGFFRPQVLVLLFLVLALLGLNQEKRGLEIKKHRQSNQKNFLFSDNSLGKWYATRYFSREEEDGGLTFSVEVEI